MPGVTRAERDVIPPARRLTAGRLTWDITGTKYCGVLVDRTPVARTRSAIDVRVLTPLHRAVEIYTRKLFGILTVPQAGNLVEMAERELAEVLLGIGATRVNFYEQVEADVGLEGGKQLASDPVMKKSYHRDGYLVCAEEYGNGRAIQAPEIDKLSTGSEIYVKQGAERIFLLNKTGPLARYVGVEFEIAGKGEDERSRVNEVVMALIGQLGEASDSLADKMAERQRQRFAANIEGVGLSVAEIRERAGAAMRAQILGCQTGSVQMFFVDPELQELVAAADYADDAMRKRFPYDSLLTAGRYLVRRRRGNGIADYFYWHFSRWQRPLLFSRDSHFDAIPGVRWRHPPGSRGSLMVAPLLNQRGGLMGVAVLTSPAYHAFSFPQFTLFAEMARHLGHTMAAAGIQERLQEQVRLDPKFGHLGIYNANYLEVYLDSLVRARTPFTIYFVDIDHFGHLNNAWSHTDVDYPLGVILERISQSPRNEDGAKTFRHGGEEIVVVVPGVASQQIAIRTGIRMMQNVAAPITGSIPYEVEEQAHAMLAYHKQHKRTYPNHGVVEMAVQGDNGQRSSDPARWWLVFEVRKTISLGCAIWQPNENEVTGATVLQFVNALEGGAKKGGRNRMMFQLFGSVSAEAIIVTSDGGQSYAYSST
jgi:diguanylate cyclase (GGDEF)-like protein